MGIQKTRKQKERIQARLEQKMSMQWQEKTENHAVNTSEIQVRRVPQSSLKVATSNQFLWQDVRHTLWAVLGGVAILFLAARFL